MPMLGGRYTVLDRIGAGRSATVYTARDAATDSVVAIKVLEPHVRTDPAGVERFRRELQITRHLGHPQIVPIFDLIEDGGQTCLVMEYVEGSNLREFGALQAPLRVPVVVSLLTQMLEILSVCHARGVVHRDLKPENILVDADQTVRLLDFGVAKMLTLGDLTQTGALIGSPEYMAPELFARSVCDPRTDLYALGIIGFELLAGRVPFQGDAVAVLYQRHASAPVPKLSTFRPDIPAWVPAMLDRLLAKEPFERYQSAEEVLTDLRRERVLSRELPVLAKRHCAVCGADTIAEVGMCLACGADALRGFERGQYDVVCTETGNDEALQRFVESEFGVAGFLRPRAKSLLVAGLDAASAAQVCANAARQRVPLAVRPHAPTAELREAVPAALLCFVLGGLGQRLSNDFAYYGCYFLDGMNAEKGAGLLVWVALAGVCLRRALRTEVRPMLAPRATLAQHLNRRFGWLDRLREFVPSGRTPAMTAFMAALVEKYVVLVKFGQSLDEETRERMQRVVEGAAAVALAVSELDALLAGPLWAERARQLAGLTATLERTDEAAERARLAGRRDELAAAMRAYYALEDRTADLTGRLVSLNALLNRLAAQAVVLAGPADEACRAALAERVENLAADLRIGREVRAELERLA